MVWHQEPRTEDPPAPLRQVPDLAGLPVDDADGRPAGVVHGTLVEAANGMVRYLDVQLHDGDRHVLVPIGHARVEEHLGRRRVRLRAVLREDLHDIPLFEPPALPPDSTYERSVLDAYSRVFYGERYYAHPAYDHSGLYADGHPILRGDPVPTAPLPLAPLSELPDYEVAEGESDIRGWPLIARNGEEAARIGDLIVDPAALAVRYVVLVRRDADPALLPVGYLEVEPEARRVRAPALGPDDIAALPPYSPPVTRADEDRSRAVLDARLDGRRRYERPEFRAR